MATVHMSEAEVARDLHAVLDKVQRDRQTVFATDLDRIRYVEAARVPVPKPG